MCVFVGVVSREHQRYRSCLSDYLEKLVHRGPDDGGEWWSEEVELSSLIEGYLFLTYHI